MPGLCRRLLHVGQNAAYCIRPITETSEGKIAEMAQQTANPHGDMIVVYSQGPLSNIGTPVSATKGALPVLRLIHSFVVLSGYSIALAQVGPNEKILGFLWVFSPPLVRADEVFSSVSQVIGVVFCPAAFAADRTQPIIRSNAPMKLSRRLAGLASGADLLCHRNLVALFRRTLPKVLNQMAEFNQFGILFSPLLTPLPVIGFACLCVLKWHKDGTPTNCYRDMQLYHRGHFA